VNCNPLANTGLNGPVLLVLAIAVACLLLGLGILFRKRSAAGPGAALLLMILALGSGVLMTATPTSPAYAAPFDCKDDNDHKDRKDRDDDNDRDWSYHPRPVSTTGPDNSLTIFQTSIMDDLAPDVAPAEIRGLVVNNGPDSTYITAIDVEIVGVVRRIGAAAGTCDASDYVLDDERMLVGQTLNSYGGSAVFAGAAIGFNNKSTQQNACQGATVQLRYTTTS